MNKSIIMDHREHAETLKACLTNQHGFSVTEEQLTLGDYVFAPRTIVERKTTRDFCVSIIDGRLFKQAWALSNYKGSAVMIVEGNSYTADHDVDVNVLAVKGALISLAQTFRLPVLRTLNETDTAWHLNQLYQQRQAIGSGNGPLHGYVPKKLNTRKAYVLRALPGIGPKSAKALLDEFGSITNVVNASERDLLKVDGIGKKTVRQIHDVLREPDEPYRA